jgi:methionyl-tRNA synthetase
MQSARIKGKWGSNAVINENGKIVEPRMLNEGLRPSSQTRDLKWGVAVPEVGDKEHDEVMKGKVICEFGCVIGWI